MVFILAERPSPLPGVTFPDEPAARLRPFPPGAPLHARTASVPARRTPDQRCGRRERVRPARQR